MRIRRKQNNNNYFNSKLLSKQRSLMSLLPPLLLLVLLVGNHNNNIIVEAFSLFSHNNHRISNSFGSSSNINYFPPAAGTAITTKTSTTTIIRKSTVTDDTTSTTTTSDDVIHQRSEQQPVVVDEFTTPEMQLFIEDTDAYGVMYNSNYIRAYDRALHMISISNRNHQQEQYAEKVSNNKDHNDDDSNNNNNDKNDNSNVNISVLNHEGWILMDVKNQKFKRSPPLGGKFVITGKLISNRNQNPYIETWDMVMKSPPPSSKDNDEQEIQNYKKPIEYNTATVTIVRPTPDNDNMIFSSSSSAVVPTTMDDDSMTTTTSSNSRMMVAKPQPFDIISKSKNGEKKSGKGEESVVVEHSFFIYRDEFDQHLLTHIPLQNVLNLFERSRSLQLGGPDVLRKLKDEDNLVWVVTKNDNCSLINLSQQLNMTKIISCSPGENVIVKTNFVLKRGGSIIECRHTLLLPHNDNDNNDIQQTGGRRRLAQAKITLMGLNATTWKPVKSIPSWLYDLLLSKGKK